MQRAFKTGLAQRGLRVTVRANKAGLDRCEHKPMVVVYPEGVWDGQITPADLGEIIQSHVHGDQPVERLRITIRA